MAKRIRARSTSRAWAVREWASCSRAWRSSGVSGRRVTLAWFMGAPPFARRPHPSYVRSEALVLLPDAPVSHEGKVLSVAFSPDGKAVLTGSADNTARLWDASTGQPIGAPMQHQLYVLAVAFSPGGKTVLTSSADGTARFWDSAGGQPIGAPMQHQGSVVA